MFTYVNPNLFVLTYFYLCLPMFGSVYCIIAFIYPCLLVFNYVYLLPKFTLCLVLY